MRRLGFLEGLGRMERRLRGLGLELTGGVGRGASAVSMGEAAEEEGRRVGGASVSVSDSPSSASRSSRGRGSKGGQSRRDGPKEGVCSDV